MTCHLPETESADLQGTSELSLVPTLESSPKQILWGVTGAMWVLALSLIRNHSEGSFDLREGIAEELYSSPCQSINIIGSNKDKSSYHLFNLYYAPRTFRFILFVLLTTMK